MFEMFDADQDGNMNYEDFLQFALPYDDMQLRAKIAQRDTYEPRGVLDSNIEFELSRLIEKEIHYHQKVEDEKRTLERQADFNMVAAFTVIDPKGFGYIDFD